MRLTTKRSQSLEGFTGKYRTLGHIWPFRGFDCTDWESRHLIGWYVDPYEERRLIGQPLKKRGLRWRTLRAAGREAQPLTSKSTQVIKGDGIGSKWPKFCSTKRLRGWWFDNAINGGRGIIAHDEEVDYLIGLSMPGSRIARIRTNGGERRSFCWYSGWWLRSGTIPHEASQTVQVALFSGTAETCILGGKDSRGTI